MCFDYVYNPYTIRTINEMLVFLFMMKTSSKTVNRRYLGDITVSGHSDTGFGLAVFGYMFMMNKLRKFSKIMMFSYTRVL